MDLAHVPLTNLLTQLVLVLSIVLIGWYLVGSQLGRSQANRLAHLAVDLLKPIGSEGSFRWLGSAGCELSLTRLRRPFKSLRVVIWLEPREMLPIWLINRWRGRRDLFAVAADLNKAPTLAFELVRDNTAVGRRALDRARARGWEIGSLEFAGEPLTLAAPQLEAARQAALRVERGLPVSPNAVLRVASSTASPNLSVSIGSPGSLRNEGPKFVNWLLTLASAVGD
jgi:hypothetical protein